MIIDRIENGLAVVEFEKGHFKNIPVDCIAGHARDGAVLIPDGNGYAVDESETKRQSETARARLSSLFDKQ